LVRVGNPISSFGHGLRNSLGRLQDLVTAEEGI
jgi:hypothetical protein